MPRSSAERTAATRASLVAAARALFAARGFAAVGTSEIVAAAGVTRGALYHHFRDKRDLFRAAFVAVEQDLLARVGERAAAEPDAYRRLLVAANASLTAAATDPETRLALVEAPAVLGFAEWRAAVEETSLGALRVLLQGAIDAGALAPRPVDPLAHLLLGALNEACRLVADGADQAATQAALVALLEGLRPRG